MSTAKKLSIADFHRLRCYRLESRKRWRYINPECRWSHPSTTEQECTPELRQALAEAFKAPTEAEVSDGDLARAALAVLAEDPQNHEMLQAQIDGPQAQQMGTLATIAIVTAALVVLQSRIKFERKDGKTTIIIDKPSMKSPDLLKLAGKFLGLTR